MQPLGPTSSRRCRRAGVAALAAVLTSLASACTDHGNNRPDANPTSHSAGTSHGPNPDRSASEFVVVRGTVLWVHTLGSSKCPYKVARAEVNENRELVIHGSVNHRVETCPDDLSASVVRGKLLSSDLGGAGMRGVGTAVLLGRGSRPIRVPVSINPGGATY